MKKTLQFLINIAYRYPYAHIKNVMKFGGPFDYIRMKNNQLCMKKAAMQLPPVQSKPAGFPIFFLTGKGYLYQTLFCIHSLVKNSSEDFKFVLIDDGTFDAEIIKKIDEKLPFAEIITQAIIQENLEKSLPKEQFPKINAKRIEYPHIKKLTDIHTIIEYPWKLVFDSDMLFLNNPVEIIDWLKTKTAPIHLIDSQESYGYSKVLMRELASTNIPHMLNVGVIGLKSSQIDWPKIENWITKLERQQGKSYYLEQAITAMVVGEKAATVLNPEQYIVNPAKSQILSGKGILHHYVDTSKKHYFNFRWKRL